MAPKRLATSQAEHEGIMAALRARDPERASKLALWHKRSVGETVGQLVTEAGDAGGSEGAGVTA
jgi:DNA-binding GntR family transcriptional regulator